MFVSVARFCQLCLAVNVARCSSLLILVEYSALILMQLDDEGCFSRPLEKNSPCPAKDLSVCRFIEENIFARTILPAK